MQTELAFQNQWWSAAVALQFQIMLALVLEKVLLESMMLLHELVGSLVGLAGSLDFSKVGLGVLGEAVLCLVAEVAPGEPDW